MLGLVVHKNTPACFCRDHPFLRRSLQGPLTGSVGGSARCTMSSRITLGAGCYFLRCLHMYGQFQNIPTLPWRPSSIRMCPLVVCVEFAVDSGRLWAKEVPLLVSQNLETLARDQHVARVRGLSQLLHNRSIRSWPFSQHLSPVQHIRLVVLAGPANLSVVGLLTYPTKTGANMVVRRKTKEPWTRGSLSWRLCVWLSSVLSFSASI